MNEFYAIHFTYLVAKIATSRTIGNLTFPMLTKIHVEIAYKGLVKLTRIDLIYWYNIEYLIYFRRTSKGLASDCSHEPLKKGLQRARVFSRQRATVPNGQTIRKHLELGVIVCVQQIAP